MSLPSHTTSKQARKPIQQAARRLGRAFTRPAVLVFGCLLLAGALAAEAATYTVTLNNGTSFITRYKPEDADWDDNVLVFTTDRGNWIALPKDDVADVISDVEASGFGYQVDTTTLFVGWSPNDLVGEEGEGGEGAAAGAGGAGQTVNENLPDPNPQPSFALEQFIDTSNLAAGQPLRNN